MLNVTTMLAREKATLCEVSRGAFRIRSFFERSEECDRGPNAVSIVGLDNCDQALASVSQFRFFFLVNVAAERFCSYSTFFFSR